MNDPILVWGAGAIGGTLGAHWARAGINVLLVDVNTEHVGTCRNSGIRIEGPIEKFQIAIPAVSPQELTGTYSRIVLAVKAHHTLAAVQEMEPHLTSDGFVLSAQNGLNELVITQVVGSKRTVGAFVNFGADWLEPGRILFGNRGASVIGELDGSTLERTHEIHDLMKIFEPEAVLTDNIWGYLWGKLAYGAMLFATALTNESMADNFTDPRFTPVWVGLAREVIGLSHVRGVTPIGFNGFDPGVFAPDGKPEAAEACIRRLAAFNRSSAKTHSGIWRDLVIRRRKTEVDDQIGILIKLADEVGLDIPLIRSLVDLIHEIEDGRRSLSPENLSILLDKCEAA